MAIPSKNADLYRRIKFYGFGFALGLVIVMSIKGKGCRMQMPGSAKLDELGSQPLVYAADSLCNIEESEIKEMIGFIDHKKNDFTSGKGKVNFDKSDVRKETHQYPTYTIEGSTAKGKNLRLVIADCDTITKVMTAVDLANAKDSCVCSQ